MFRQVAAHSSAKGSVLDAELPLAGSSFSSQLYQLSREVSRVNTGECMDDSLNPRQPGSLPAPQKCMNCRAGQKGPR